MSHLVILKLFQIPPSPDWSFNMKRLLFTSLFCVYTCWVPSHLHLHAQDGCLEASFSQRFWAKWVHTQTCFATVLWEDLGDEPLRWYKFGHQSFTEQTLNILPMCAGQHTEPKSWDSAFTIDVGAASILVSAEKHKYLSSVNYIKEVTTYLNYEWSAASAQLGRVTFKGVCT